MAEFDLGEAVEVGDDSVQLGPQAGTLRWVGGAVFRSLSPWERVGVRVIKLVTALIVARFEPHQDF